MQIQEEATTASLQNSAEQSVPWESTQKRFMTSTPENPVADTSGRDQETQFSGDLPSMVSREFLGSQTAVSSSSGRWMSQAKLPTGLVPSESKRVILFHVPAPAAGRYSVPGFLLGSAHELL